MNKLTTTNVDVSHPKIPKLVLPRRRMIMSAVSLAPTRRSFLATSAAAGAFGLLFVVLFAAMVSLAPPATVLAAEDDRNPPVPRQGSGSGTHRIAQAHQRDKVA